MTSFRRQLQVSAEARLSQLRVVHEELNRQRDATAAKHQTMYQRAGLLIGASSIVTGVQSARIPGSIHRLIDDAALASPMSPQLVLHIASASLAAVATIAAAMAAIWGIRTLWVERGSEIDVEKLAINALGAEPDVYATEWSLLGDKLGVHAEDNKRLEAKRLLFSRGAKTLVVSWVAAILQFATSW